MRTAPFIAMLFVLFSAGPAFAEGGCCTLEALFALWDEGHPLQRISRADLDAAREDAAAAWGAWVPQLSSRARAGTNSGMVGDGFTGMREPHSVGIFGSFRVDFVAPLFASGQLWVLQDLAALGVAVAEETHEAERQSFRWRARSAWLAVQGQRSRTSTLDRADALLERLKAARGDIAPDSPDAFALEVLGADLGGRRIRQEEALERARIALGRFAGGELALPDALGDFDLPLGSEWTLEIALQEALRSRPDWRAALNALQAADLNATLQSLRWLPEIGLVARWATRRATKVTDQTGSYQQDPYNGGAGGMALGIQWDVDPARRLREAGDAVWTAKGGAALLEAMEGQIRWEVRSALAEEHRSRRRVEAEDASTEAALGWLEAQTAESMKASAPIAPFAKAVRQHLHRQDRQIAARLSLFLARARRARVMGTDIPR